MKNYLIIALFSAWLFPFSYMYGYDWPQALSTPLQRYPYNYSLFQINLFYAFVALGVILFCFKLGMLFDTLPLTKTLIIVPLLAAISQLITALVFYLKLSWSYYIACLCRFLVGILGQSMFILQAIAITRIFKDQAKYYIGGGVAFGVIGSATNSFLTPIFYDYFNNVEGPLFICGIILLGSIFLGFGIIYAVKKISQSQINNQKLLPKKQQVQQYKAPQNIFKQIKSFSSQFWVLQIVIFLKNCTCSTFVSIGIDIISKRFTIQYLDAGKLFIIPLGVSSLSCLVWYKLRGNVRNYLLITSIMNLIVFLALYFLPNTNNPKSYYYAIIIIVLVINGIAYGGFMMKVVPIINYITKPEQIGAAYSLVPIVVNLCFFLLPTLASFFVKSFSNQIEGYKNLMLLYIGFAALETGITFWIRISKTFENYEIKEES